MTLLGVVRIFFSFFVFNFIGNSQSILIIVNIYFVYYCCECVFKHSVVKEKLINVAAAEFHIMSREKEKKKQFMKTDSPANNANWFSDLSVRWIYSFLSSLVFF